MKKIIQIIFLLLSLFLMTSCNIDDGPAAERIMAPENQTSPINGKWIISSNINEIKSDEIELKSDPHLNKEVLFHKDAVVIGEEYSTEPSFKFKTVNAYDYLLYKYKTTPNNLGIEDSTINVITILNENQYFYEFIKHGDEELLVNIEDNFYKLSKLVDEVSIEEINRYIDVERNTIRALNIEELDDSKSGLLLGIKTPTYDEKGKLADWNYKTIWINSLNNKIIGVYELDDLLVPRKNGFWMVNVNRNYNGLIQDQITATPLFKLPEISTIDEDEMEILLSSRAYGKEEQDSVAVLNNILFIGNDYISIEKINKFKQEKKTLEVYAMDNIEEKRPINLSDLIGEDGKRIFTEGAQSVVSIDTQISLNEENVGIVRKSGYWTIKGRVNYVQNDEELYKDFNIKAIPPKEMINYDAHIISWNELKMSIPETLDAFTSPNNDIIVVSTHSHLLIYNIIDGGLSNIPLAKIKLPENSSIIMSEWSVGRYPTIWQNEVIKNKGIELEYKID